MGGRGVISDDEDEIEEEEDVREEEKEGVDIDQKDDDGDEEDEEEEGHDEYEKDGFIADDVEEGEEEDDKKDDSDEEMNRKKKKKIRETEKNYDLDEDDYTLLEDNITGYHRPKPIILKIVKDHPRDVSQDMATNVYYGDESLPHIYETSRISSDQLPAQPAIVKRSVGLGRYRLTRFYVQTESLGVLSSSTRALIGIKKMGEVDGKAFLISCKRKFAEDEAEIKAAEYCSEIQAEIRKPEWHPFKVIAVDGSIGKYKVEPVVSAALQADQSHEPSPSQPVTTHSHAIESSRVPQETGTCLLQFLPIKIREL